MKVLKVALTGGPCGGKTTSIQKIEKEFTEKGYNVIVVPEAATILINSGIKPFGMNAVPPLFFQRYVLSLQNTLEQAAINAASKQNGNTIILCDRGMIDSKAYIDKKTYDMLLDELDKTELEVMYDYDLVVHLKTAADGKEEFYTLENNTARSESPEEARYKDQRTLNAWLGHENLKIIGNDTNFDEKMNRVLREIYKKLKKPYPIQVQYRYLIDYVDFEKMNNIENVKLDIEQYVIRKSGADMIYRKTEKSGDIRYSMKIKSDTEINSERIIFIERNVCKDEYIANLPKNEIPMKKTRYCFSYKDEYYRLDVFEDGLMMLELEITDKSKETIIPDFIKVKEDVTEDVNYRNSSIYFNNNLKSKVYSYGKI